MAKAPKTYEGVRTAVIAMVPDGVEDATVQVHVHIVDHIADGYKSQLQYWGARIVLNHEGIEIEAEVNGAKSAAKLLQQLRGEMNRAIRAAFETKRLDLKQPRLEFSK